jgi:hypothetical protein
VFLDCTFKVVHFSRGVNLVRFPYFWPKLGPELNTPVLGFRKPEPGTGSRFVPNPVTDFFFKWLILNIRPKISPFFAHNWPIF